MKTDKKPPGLNQILDQIQYPSFAKFAFGCLLTIILVTLAWWVIGTYFSGGIQQQGELLRAHDAAESMVINVVTTSGVPEDQMERRLQLSMQTLLEADHPNITLVYARITRQTSGPAYWILEYELKHDKGGTITRHHCFNQSRQGTTCQ